MYTARDPLSREVLAKLHIARRAVENAIAKDVRCPVCGRLLMRKYPGAQGYINEKCSKCGREMIVDLVSWRRRKS